MTAETATAWGTWVAAIAAIIALFVASFQLSSLADSFRLSGLATVLTMEGEMSERAERVSAFSFQIQLGLKEKTIPDNQLPFYLGRLRQLTDGYLQAVDRFAFCVLNRYLKDSEWRPEYEPTINDLFDGPGKDEAVKRYKNIVKLYTRWQQTPADSDDVGDYIRPRSY